MEQGIKFVITGDAKGLEQETTKSQKMLSQLERNVEGVRKAINKSSRTSLEYQRAISNLNKDLRSGRISQADFAKESDRLTDRLQKANSETLEFQKELTRLERETKRVKESMDSVAISTSRVPTEMKKLSTTTSAGARDVRTASYTAIQFSRVMSAVPHGVDATSDAVVHLGRQFNVLAKGMGGVQPAFKAMISSLAGPTGIFLAVSAIIPTLISLFNSSKKAAEGVDELGKSADGTKDSIDDLRKSVVSLGQAQLGLTLFQNDIISIQKDEIVTLKSLLSVARDETKSREERQRALDRINKDYSQYIDNVTLETSSLNKAKKSIDEYNESLSLENSIKETSEAIFQKRRDLIGQETEARVRATQALRRLGDSDVDEERFIADFIARETEKTRKELNGIEQTLQEFVSQRLQRVLPGDIGKEISERLKLSPIDIQVRPQIDIKSFDQIVAQAEKGGQGIVNAFQQLEQQKGVFQPITSDIEGLTKVTTPAQVQFAENLIKMREEARIFSEIGGAAIGGFAQKLTQDLQTGNAVMDAVVSSMIQAGAKLLQELIAQQAQGLAAKQAFTTASLATDTAAATGSAIAGGASAGAATGPGAVAAIPAFIALLVGVVAAAFAAIGSFAQGGIVGGGRFTGDNIPIFVNSGERILTRQDQSLLTQFLRGGYAGTTNRTGDMGPIRIEGEIRGDNIRLSNERAIRRNRRFGSGINN